MLIGCTNQVLVASVDGQVAEGNGHSSDHLIGVRAQQLHQDGKTFLLAHCGSDVVGPLEGRQSAWCDGFFKISTFNHRRWLSEHTLSVASCLTFMESLDSHLGAG